MEDQDTTPAPKRGSKRSTATPGGGASGTADDTRSAAHGTSGYSSEAVSGQANDDQGRGLVDRVRERAAAGLSTQKERATEGLGSVAQAVRQSTQQLRDQKHDTVAQYVDQAADQLDRVTQQLRRKDVGELVEDAQRLARRQPALFVGGAFALGLIGARFLKSSPPEHDRYGSYGGDRSGGFRDSYSERTSSGRSIGTITGTARDVPGTETY